ncbi:MAG TPA: signal peptide peptidase SppA [Phycisphaerae bacterium]|nr:signal peptide peptidase SppA [Phycisphaerae bacterium]
MKPIHPITRAAWVVVLAGLPAATGCGPTAYKITPVPAQEDLQETVVLTEGGLFPTKILLLDVDGLIINSRKFSLWGTGENPVSLFVEKLDKAADDPAVKAVVLRINSPGGGVTASDLMYGEVLNFKKRTGRPVVAVLMDVAASGGYYLACSADEIVAQPTTVTGSIGVIMQTVSFAGTMSKLGITADAITSGKMKDAGSPLRKMQPEEREVFQTLVSRFHDRFVSVVAAGRGQKLTEAKIREVADGRVYSAQQALEIGFVDRIGTLKDALAMVKEKLGAKRVVVVSYQRPTDYKPNIYADAPAPVPQVNLVNIQMPETWSDPAPQFMYLWAPGH